MKYEIKVIHNRECWYERYSNPIRTAYRILSLRRDGYKVELIRCS